MRRRHYMPSYQLLLLPMLARHGHDYVSTCKSIVGWLLLITPFIVSAGGGGGGTTTATGPTPTGGLDAAIKAKGKKYFGTCADSALLSNSQNAAVIKSDFGALTPENSASTLPPRKNAHTIH